MTRATGELSEYMLRAKERQAGSEHFTDYESTRLNSADALEWLEGLKSYTQRWVDEHRNGGADKAGQTIGQSEPVPSPRPAFVETVLIR